MDYSSQDTGKITGAEFAARLLAIDKPERNLDHLLEKLSAKTSTGWESNLLELKAAHHPSPNFPNDPDYKQPAVFEWNVMHAFISLANAQGGCVVIGIKETNDHHLIPGDWDPDEIITKRDANGIRQPTGRESKDLINSIEALFFAPRRQNNGSSYQFTKQDPKRQQAPANQFTYELTAKTIKRLHALVKFYSCNSTACNCNAIVAIVHPVAQGDATLTVKRKRNQSDPEQVMFYRDSEAQTKEHTDWDEIRIYEQSRDPASSDFYKQLHAPLEKPSARPPCPSFSTMRKPEEHFIGRENEIVRLKEVCASGKIALVTAPGGTGKTQLVLKFAECVSANYPGGKFFIPVEHAVSWDDILHRLIDQQNSSNGQTPEEWLGLDPKNAPDSTQKPSGEQQRHILTLSEIANALKRKAITVGRLLLVLDNMDDPALLLSETSLLHVFPQGVPGNIHIVVTARSIGDVIPRKCPSVTPFVINDISIDDARTILNGGQPFTSAEERDAADEIIRLLNCRALYIVRIANFANRLAEQPLVRLLKKLNADILATIRPQRKEDDKRTPSMFWQWTKNKLVETPEGQKDIQTLQALALFPADGIPQFVLEALWYADFGDIHGLDILFAHNEDPYLFKDTLKRLAAYNIIQQDEVSGMLSMHRLDRTAIAEDLSLVDSGQIAKIGLALHDSPSVSPETWIWLAQRHSPLTSHCCWEFLRGNELADILAVQPERADDIPEWSSRLNGHDWGRLLSAQPQFSSKLINFSLLDTNDWNDLVSNQPSFIEDPHCPKADLSPQSILKVRPDLFPHFDLRTFHGGDWGALLKHRPELADQCPWSSFNHEEWFNLLLANPDFADSAPDEFWPGLCYEIGLLLDRQPVLLEKCMTYVKSGELTLPTQIWPHIIDLHPEYEYLCPFDEFDPDNWATFLSLRPDWIKKIPNPMACVCDTGCLSQLLSEQPQLAAYFPHTYVAIAQEDGDIQARLGTLDLLHLKDNQLDNLVSRGDHYHAHQLLMRIPSLRYLSKFSKMPFEQHEIADILNCQPQLKSFLVP